MTSEHRIEITRNWKPGGRRWFFPGPYRIPADLSEALADQAVREGVAHRLEAAPKPHIAPPAPISVFSGATVVVAAPGPSLTPEVAEACKGHPTIVVNDAYRLMPWADVLYACDAAWWDVHNGAPDFAGERWSSHGSDTHNDKRAVAERYGVRLVGGRDGEGFSTDPSVIHYGNNSGFQAVNLAIAWGARRIVLVGFNMQAVKGKRHFFGDHPEPLRVASPFKDFATQFRKAAGTVPAGVEIINATPASALACFPRMDLADALAP